ncbi:MAG: DinB family protein [Flavobacterium sp.]
MKELQRISDLFSNLYDGEPWIDTTLVGSLQNISYLKAAEKYKNCNSIWEIANHIIAWRENVLQRVQGKVITTPNHNYFESINDISENAWKNTLQHLEESQQKWMVFLEHFDKKKFDKIYPNNNLNYYEHIHGIIQHDAYHLGQITILSKLV